MCVKPFVWKKLYAEAALRATQMDANPEPETQNPELIGTAEAVRRRDK